MNNDKSTKKEINLNKYDDPIDLSPKNLEFGLWLVNNRDKIYKFLVITLTVIAASFVLYSGYGYFHYFMFGKQQDATINDDSGINLSVYRAQNQASDLLLGQVKVIKNNGNLDFIIKIKNPNQKHFANFSYCFTADDKEFCESGFVLPAQEKNIISLNNSFPGFASKVDFKIKDLAWQKINAGDIPNWEYFEDQRSNFEITDPKINSYADNISYLEFNITNHSPFSYFSIPLNITIERNNETVAINRYIIKDLNSRANKNIKLSWPEAVDLNGLIKVEVDLNILDKGIYKPYGQN
jgi:hypothetical protein